MSQRARYRLSRFESSAMLEPIQKEPLLVLDRALEVEYLLQLRAWIAQLFLVYVLEEQDQLPRVPRS